MRANVWGNLYAVQVGEFIKVGWTSRAPEARARELRARSAGCLLPREISVVAVPQVIWTMHAQRRWEKAAHSWLSEWHVVGEWFRADPDVMATLHRFQTRVDDAQPAVVVP